jgi:hypothetical protein
MNVSSLHIQELNENNLIKLDNFLINEVNSTLSDKKVALEKVELKGLEINAHLDENKELNFVKASDFSKLIKALEKYQTTSATTSTELPKKNLPLEVAKPWQFSVDNIDLENMNLAFFDESIATPAKQTISDIKFSAININNNPNHIFDSTLQATVNEHSQFLLKSQTSLNPIQNNSQLSLTPLSLKSLQGYIAEFINASLEECKISTDTKITYSEGKAMLSGNFNSSDFQLNSLDNEPLISYGNFAINGFNIDPLNLIVKVDEVQLKEPKMFIDVDSQSQVNLTKILKETPPSKDEPGEPAQKEDSSKAQVKPLIEVKKFILNNAYGKLTDQSIKPNFSISLDKFSGSVDNISNNANQQSNWFFQGFVNNYAPLKVKGNSRFLATPFALDLNLSLQNLGLTGFSPYTGTFIGYKLQEGQLSLDLDYSLENNELDGKNKVLMKRFELGDSVDSDKAVNLPIKLGVALIRDYNKNIDLDLNIHGDINDPNFSVLNLLWKVFSNIIVKAATSPFSLLGNLASSGQDDLNLLKFEAGSSELNEEEKTKLQTLSDALEKRPSLALNITGYFENEVDTEQLKKTQLDTIIKRRIALLQKEEPDSDMLERRALSLIYEEKSGESWEDLQKRLQTPINLATKNTANEATNITQVKTSKPRSRIRNGKFKSRRSSTKKKSTTPPSAERQTELLAPTTDSNTTETETPQNIEVVAYDFLLKELVLETDELEQLAQNRAKAVKEFLIQDLKVPVSRVFLLAPKEAKNQRFVELNLDAL